ncbi:hypothetical protein AVEN_41730-1 [Araneus ventricosus]|uniref:Uncharacterized protein n=1 Tax=Araneus ventricosus TaxID=182803 RepID=A0A4Y2ABX3_ARAVE|nr:hypothetical protein AVEN_41730-1 [Araneus ventricosus]
MKQSLDHGDAIRRKRPGMLSDGVILLHGNAHAARKTQELLQKFKWESLKPPSSYGPYFEPNLGSKHLSGTRFSSDSNVETAGEN